MKKSDVRRLNDKEMEQVVGGLTQGPIVRPGGGGGLGQEGGEVDGSQHGQELTDGFVGTDIAF